MIYTKTLLLLTLATIINIYSVNISLATSYDKKRDLQKAESYKTKENHNRYNSSVIRYYIAADYARRNNDPQSSAKILLKALKDAPNNPNLIKKAYMAMLISGKVQKSVSLAGKHLEFEPDSAIANMVVAISNIKQGEFLKAEKNLNSIEDNDYSETSDLNKIITNFLRISTKAGQEKFKEALEHTKKILKQDNTPSLFLYYHSAILNDLSGNIEAAEKDFQYILKNNIVIPYHLAKTAGNFYRRIGKNDIAQEIYASYKNQNHEFNHFQKELSDLQSNIPPNDKIIKNVSYLAAEVFQEAARVLYGSRYFEKGIFYLNLSKYLRPNNDEADVLLAKYYEDSNRYDDAIEIYKNIKIGSDFYISSRMNMADNLYDLGKKDESISQLYKLVEYSKEIQNKSKIVSLTLAEILRKEKRYLDAIKIYSDIINDINEPSLKDWPIFFARSICYERAKKWDMAEKDLLLALELKPDQPEILNYLGYSWIDRDINIKKAIKMIEKAVKSRPDDAQIIDSMGWALYKIGSFEEAAGYLEDATQIAPYDPVINDHLGDTYWKLGRYNEAIFQWNRTIKYHQNSKDVSIEKVKKKIEDGIK